jgi:hypothetical protein
LCAPLWLGVKVGQFSAPQLHKGAFSLFNYAVAKKNLKFRPSDEISMKK